MNITFIGAAHEVTGSCTLIEVNGTYGIVDFGMEQGADTFVNCELPVDPSKLSFVLLTHAHIDHSGKIPLLYKNGYSGYVYATRATCDLSRIMLRDSAHIQESEAQWKSRKAQRRGEPPYEPIYTMMDAEAALKKLRPCSYGEIIRISENVAVRFGDIGHLLGSSCIEVWLTENDITKKIVFSGDIGNKSQPIIKDPGKIAEADYVVTESTYGDRYHEAGRSDYITYLADCIQRTLDRGGNVVIPSFAVGRTQEILYFIRHIKENGLVKGHDGFPVYLDSPLANEATGIFLQCDTEFLDEEVKAIMASGVNPIVFDGLRISVTSDDSKQININKEPKVIISASGMCEAGRIRHHLKYNLWRPESMVLFVGYQAVGSLGRAIYDGAKKVKLFGEEISVKAEITYLPGKSGHADKAGLIEWINGFEKKPQMVFVNHGDDEVCESYAECLTNEHGFKAFAPYSGTVFDLLACKFVECPEGIPVPKKTPAQSRAEDTHARLVASGKKLMDTINACKGMPNKELAKFISQIENLCTKWSK